MNQHPGVIGIKLGMTQFFLDNGTVVPCTVIQAACRVVGKRTEERDGYSALILGLGEKKAKRTSKAVKTAFEKVGQKAPQHTREIRLSAEAVAAHEIGQVLKVEDIFEAGQFVDVQSRSKGKGFSGVIKRHHFSGSKATHGAGHEDHRHGGSIGMATTPGRVFPGTEMAGQHGNRIVSVLSQKVAKVIADEQLVFIEGSVPGPPSAVVRLQGAVKKKNGGKKK